MGPIPAKKNNWHSQISPWAVLLDPSQALHLLAPVFRGRLDDSVAWNLAATAGAKVLEWQRGDLEWNQSPLVLLVQRCLPFRPLLLFWKRSKYVLATLHDPSRSRISTKGKELPFLPFAEMNMSYFPPLVSKGKHVYWTCFSSFFFVFLGGLRRGRSNSSMQRRFTSRRSWHTL